jgi:hypothetical protein
MANGTAETSVFATSKWPLRTQRRPITTCHCAASTNPKANRPGATRAPDAVAEAERTRIEGQARAAYAAFHTSHHLLESDMRANSAVASFCHASVEKPAFCSAALYLVSTPWMCSLSQVLRKLSISK